MSSTEPIDGAKRRGWPKGKPRAPRKDGFAGGTITPQQALAKRWSNERRSIVEECKKLTPVALKVLTDVMVSGNAKDADRIRAGEIVLSYGHGKPSQQVDLTVSRGPDIAELSRDALMSALTRAAAREGVALPHLPGTVIEHAPIADRCVAQAAQGESA